MNQITIAGYVGKDPETKQAGDQNMTKFTVATNKKVKGEDVTTWWTVIVFGTSMNGILGHVKKGSALIVTGELSKPTVFQSRDGSSKVGLTIIAHQLQFSPFKQRESSEQGREQKSFDKPAQSEGEPFGGFSSSFSDDVPF